ncbi:MAG: IPT/TIG domain-containing protein [Flavobacterium sp.]
MKKITILSLLILFSIFISCSSDEPAKETPITPVIVTPSAITITSASSEFLYSGETLQILGANFVNKDYPTKIVLNDIEVTPKSLTNTTLQVVIPENIRTGNNVLKIQIDKIISPSVAFYAMVKGWNKLEIFGEKDVVNSSVFDESKTLFSFVDMNISSNSFNGQGVKLSPMKDGYKEQIINASGGTYGSFKMFDEKSGVITNTIAAFYSDNSFETHKAVRVDNGFSPEINGLRIGALYKNSSILTTFYGSQMYTSDNGLTVVTYNGPTWSLKRTATSTAARVAMRGFGKSISDNKYYQLGLLFDTKKYGNNVYKNVVMESPTGYGDWIVKDTITNAGEASFYKFIDINKIYSINFTNKALIESTDQLKTWKVIKDNVSAFFMRSTTKWYIQSDNKIFVTSDAGQTWNLELELPTGAVVNDISFSNKKIIVSGKKGLLYLKIE